MLKTRGEGEAMFFFRVVYDLQSLNSWDYGGKSVKGRKTTQV
jgi:hypothetical protein